MKEQEQISWGWASAQYLPNLYTKYRVTSTIFNALWGKQEGLCPGCVKPLAHPLLKEAKMGFKPEVDHCHVRLVVRGLLCRRCNDFLGKIRDNKEQLKRLEEYLRRSESDVDAISTR